jgi:hypothetical protein
MRPLLPTEGGDPRLHIAAPRDDLDCSRRVWLGAEVRRICRHRKDIYALVNVAAYARFRDQHATVLRRYQDARDAARLAAEGNAA